MKITIDIDALATSRTEALSTPSVPLPPPELLKRAKAIGAISAGPANLGLRPPTDLTAAAAEAVERVPKKKAKKRSTPRKPG